MRSYIGNGQFQCSELGVLKCDGLLVKIVVIEVVNNVLT